MIKIAVIAPLVFAGFFFFFLNRPQSIQADQPVNLTYNSPRFEEEKGLIILKIAFTVKAKNPATVEITPLLPTPWQFLRKEVSQNGQGYIEVAYLTGSPTGYPMKTGESIATLTFKEKGQLEIDTKKSTVMTKAGKQHPLSIKVVK